MTRRIVSTLLICALPLAWPSPASALRPLQRGDHPAGLEELRRDLQRRDASGVSSSVRSAPTGLEEPTLAHFQTDPESLSLKGTRVFLPLRGPGHVKEGDREAVFTPDDLLVAIKTIRTLNDRGVTDPHLLIHPGDQALLDRFELLSQEMNLRYVPVRFDPNQGTLQEWKRGGLPGLSLKKGDWTPLFVEPFSRLAGFRVSREMVQSVGDYTSSDRAPLVVGVHGFTDFQQVLLPESPDVQAVDLYHEWRWSGVFKSSGHQALVGFFYDSPLLELAEEAKKQDRFDRWVAAKERLDDFLGKVKKEQDPSNWSLPSDLLEGDPYRIFYEPEPEGVLVQRSPEEIGRVIELAQQADPDRPVVLFVSYRPQDHKQWVAWHQSQKHRFKDLSGAFGPSFGSADSRVTVVQLPALPLMVQRRLMTAADLSVVSNEHTLADALFLAYRMPENAPLVLYAGINPGRLAILTNPMTFVGETAIGYQRIDWQQAQNGRFKTIGAFRQQARRPEAVETFRDLVAFEELLNNRATPPEKKRIRALMTQPDDRQRYLTELGRVILSNGRRDRGFKDGEITEVRLGDPTLVNGLNVVARIAQHFDAGKDAAEILRQPGSYGAAAAYREPSGLAARARSALQGGLGWGAGLVRGLQSKLTRARSARQGGNWADFVKRLQSAMTPAERLLYPYYQNSPSWQPDPRLSGLYDQLNRATNGAVSGGIRLPSIDEIQQIVGRDRLSEVQGAVVKRLGGGGSFLTFRLAGTGAVIKYRYIHSAPHGGRGLGYEFEILERYSTIQNTIRAPALLGDSGVSQRVYVTRELVGRHEELRRYADRGLVKVIENPLEVVIELSRRGLNDPDMKAEVREAKLDTFVVQQEVDPLDARLKEQMAAGNLKDVESWMDRYFGLVEGLWGKGVFVFDLRLNAVGILGEQLKVFDTGGVAPLSVGVRLPDINWNDYPRPLSDVLDYIRDEVKKALKTVASAAPANLSKQAQSLSAELSKRADELLSLPAFMQKWGRERSKLEREHLVIANEWIIQQTGLGEAAVEERLEAVRQLKSLVPRGVDGPARVEVDLQMHTLHSDGYDTPSAIVYEAYRKGLKAIAITDHYTLDGLPEAMAAGEILEVEVIPGVELDTDLDGLEFLGYFPRIRDPQKMRDFLDGDALDSIRVIQRSHLKRAKEILRKFQNLLPDVAVTKDDLVPYQRSGPLLHGNVYSVYRDKIGKDPRDLLRDRGIPWDPSQLLPQGWDRSPEAVLQVLKEAGAVTSVAHPAEIIRRQGWSLEQLQSQLEAWIEKDLIQGVEVSAQSNVDIPNLDAEIMKIADAVRSRFPDKPFVGTVGSDSHGRFQPKRVLGFGRVDDGHPNGNLIADRGTYAVVEALRKAAGLEEPTDEGLPDEAEASGVLLRPAAEWTTGDWIGALSRVEAFLHDPSVRRGLVGEGRPLPDFLSARPDLKAPEHRLGLSVLAELADIYGPDPSRVEEEARRYLRVVRIFEERYGAGPVVLFRAPGRGGLMGGHLDYNGGEQMLFSLPVDTVAAVRGGEDDRVRLASTDPRFPEEEFGIQEALPAAERGEWSKVLEKVGVPPRRWSNYVKGAVLYWQNRHPREELRGMEMLFDSTLPMERGISSSSALVVITGMAVHHVNGKPFNAQELAERSGEAEWYVGTRGGGLDHAASVLGERNRILRLAPDSPQRDALAVPEGYRLVMVDSGVPADKTGTALRAFNQRSAETRLLGLALFKARFPEYADRVRHLADVAPGRLGVPEDQVEALIERLPETVSTEALEREVPEAVAELKRLYPGLPEPAGGWKIRSRVRHVVREVGRVEEAWKALRGADMASVGRLMNESFRSLRDDYEVTVPALERLAEMLQGLPGVMGVNLQGGGFGGLVMALVRGEELRSVLATLSGRYDAFVAAPSRGAGPVLPASGLKGLYTERPADWIGTRGVPIGRVVPIRGASGELAGRIVLPDAERVRIVSAWNPEIESGDFPRWQDPTEPFDRDGLDRLHRAGKLFSQWRRELEVRAAERGSPLVFLANHFQWDFTENWGHLIVDGEVVRQRYAAEQYPLDAAFLRRRGYDDALWTFVLEPGPPRLTALRYEGDRPVSELLDVDIRDGAPAAGQTRPLAEGEIRHAVAGLPIILNGRNVAAQLRNNILPDGSRREHRPNEVTWPLDRQAAFSVMGTTGEGGLFFLALTQHMAIDEVARFLETQEAVEVVDAVLMGGSADVNQWLSGQAQPLLSAEADAGSTQAGAETGRAGLRPLNAVLAGFERAGLEETATGTSSRTVPRADLPAGNVHWKAMAPSAVVQTLALAGTTGLARELLARRSAEAVSGPVRFVVDTGAGNPEVLRLLQLAVELRLKGGLPIQAAGVATRAELEAALDRLSGLEEKWITEAEASGIVRGWKTLTPAEQKAVLRSLEEHGYTLEKYRRHRDLVLGEEQGERASFAGFPPSVDGKPGSPDRKRLLKAGRDPAVLGKVGIVIAAGGEGTRLLQKSIEAGLLPKDGLARFTKPTTPVMPVTGNSVLAYQLQTYADEAKSRGVPLPVRVVLHPEAGAKVAEEIRENDGYGVERLEVVYPGMNAALDSEGKIVLRGDKTVSFNPDGTGGVVRAALANGGSEWFAGVLGEEALIEVINGDMLVEPELLELVAGARTEHPVVGIGYDYPAERDPDNDDPTANHKAKLGTFVTLDVDGTQQVGIVEYREREMVHGLNAAVLKAEAEGRPIQANSGLYGFPLKGLLEKVTDLPPHIQRDKDAQGVEGKVQKVEEFAPDIPKRFPAGQVGVLSVDPAILTSIKNPDALREVRRIALERERGRARALGMALSDEARVEFHPAMNREGRVRVGKNVRVEGPVGLYIHPEGVRLYTAPQPDQPWEPFDPARTIDLFPAEPDGTVVIPDDTVFSADGLRAGLADVEVPAEADPLSAAYNPALFRVPSPVSYPQDSPVYRMAEADPAEIAGDLKKGRLVRIRTERMRAWRNLWSKQADGAELKELYGMADAIADRPAELNLAQAGRVIELLHHPNEAVAAAARDVIVQARIHGLTETLENLAAGYRGREALGQPAGPYAAHYYRDALTTVIDPVHKHDLGSPTTPVFAGQMTPQRRKELQKRLEQFVRPGNDLAMLTGSGQRMTAAVGAVEAGLQPTDSGRPTGFLDAEIQVDPGSQPHDVVKLLFALVAKKFVEQMPSWRQDPELGGAPGDMPERWTVGIGMDPRASGGAVLRTVTRVFRNEGVGVKFSGITSAPEAAARALFSDSEGNLLGFFEITPSHIAQGNQGTKLMLWLGQILPWEKAVEFNDKIREAAADPEEINALIDTLTDPSLNEEVAEVIQDMPRGYRESRARYHRYLKQLFTGNFREGPGAEKELEADWQALGRDLRDRGVVLVIDLNGGARIPDLPLFQELGVGIVALGERAGDFAHFLPPGEISARLMTQFADRIAPALEAEGLTPIFVGPDPDGDRKSIILRDPQTRRFEYLDPQVGYMLDVLYHVALSQEAGIEGVGVVGNGPTTVAAQALAGRLGYTFRTAETGEANVVRAMNELMADLAAKHGAENVAVMGGEGSAAATILGKVQVRDMAQAFGSAFGFLRSPERVERLIERLVDDPAERQKLLEEVPSWYERKELQYLLHRIVHRILPPMLNADPGYKTEKHLGIGTGEQKFTKDVADELLAPGSQWRARIQRETAYWIGQAAGEPVSPDRVVIEGPFNNVEAHQLEGAGNRTLPDGRTIHDGGYEIHVSYVPAEDASYGTPGRPELLYKLWMRGSKTEVGVTRRLFLGTAAFLPRKKARTFLANLQEGVYPLWLNFLNAVEAEELRRHVAGAFDGEYGASEVLRKKFKKGEISRQEILADLTGLTRLKIEATPGVRAANLEKYAAAGSPERNDIDARNLRWQDRRAEGAVDALRTLLDLSAGPAAEIAKVAAEVGAAGGGGITAGQAGRLEAAIGRLRGVGAVRAVRPLPGGIDSAPPAGGERLTPDGVNFVAAQNLVIESFAWKMDRLLEGLDFSAGRAVEEPAAVGRFLLQAGRLEAVLDDLRKMAERGSAIENPERGFAHANLLAADLILAREAEFLAQGAGLEEPEAGTSYRSVRRTDIGAAARDYLARTEVARALEAAGGVLTLSAADAGRLAGFDAVGARPIRAGILSRWDPASVAPETPGIILSDSDVAAEVELELRDLPVVPAGADWARMAAQAVPGAGPRDLLLVESEDGLTDEIIEAALRSRFPAGPLPQVVRGALSEYRALGERTAAVIRAIWVARQQRPDFPAVVRIGVVLKLQSESGDTYQLLLMT